MIPEINPDIDQIAAPDYTMRIFDPPRFRRTVESVVPMVEKLKEKHPQIEALAACGHSGVFLVGAVAYHTNLPIIGVRKTLDSPHDHSLVNGWIGCEGYLIVDDLIASGRTIDRIIKSITDMWWDYSHVIDWAKDPSGKTRGPLRPGYRSTPPKPMACLLFDHDYAGKLNAIWNQEKISIPCYSTSFPDFKIPNDDNLHYRTEPRSTRAYDNYEYERFIKSESKLGDLKLAS